MLTNNNNKCNNAIKIQSAAVSGTDLYLQVIVL